ncbi:dTDP-4-dehydrorhamnose 3,5-epimerase [Cognataquiflexum rubidum]|uniref:dTDP-4-dehydrorhamnose 3,5-epimerase n=1 Tax=Cognataquiflexum rubidum TaxID=2922273 RepID=UPI001F12D406|nr:dTDP-4-dehydrorhamnose 3,5-epimerase [Cognataquiflexum rubidum]MCH6234488.1 dTDP-4-dehydrorhamnose 3,5-epimerase [Cognataquiflexum rubidum]
MEIQKTNIKDCFLIQPRVFEDERGYFLESFNSEKFEQITGIETEFVQDNESMSNYGVIRGLHAQRGESAQAKLIRVIHGTVIDVVVDARFDSPTFGEIFTVEISSTLKNQLFIPKGCLHGFSVLEDKTIFSYKCDAFYNPEMEIGVYPLDRYLAIDWKVDTTHAQISLKDQKAMSWLEYVASFEQKRFLKTVQVV